MTLEERAIAIRQAEAIFTALETEEVVMLTREQKDQMLDALELKLQTLDELDAAFGRLTSGHLVALPALEDAQVHFEGEGGLYLNQAAH